jgi:hypothetical protein
MKFSIFHSCRADKAALFDRQSQKVEELLFINPAEQKREIVGGGVEKRVV